MSGLILQREKVAKKLEKELKEGRERRISEFSTESAHYCLDRSLPLVPKFGENLERYDAIVLGSISPVVVYESLSYLCLLMYPQFKRILIENEKLKNPRPIFLVDPPVTRCLRNMCCYGGIGGYYDCEKMIDGLLEDNEIPWKILPEPYSSLVKGMSLRGCRSAIAAQKVEEFVAPEIGKRKGEKPWILVLYHLISPEIEVYLKDKETRNMVLELYETQHIWDEDYKNKILEFRFFTSPEPSSRSRNYIVSRERESERRGIRKILNKDQIAKWEKIIYEVPI